MGGACGLRIRLRARSTNSRGSALLLRIGSRSCRLTAHLHDRALAQGGDQREKASARLGRAVVAPPVQVDRSRRQGYFQTYHKKLGRILARLSTSFAPAVPSMFSCLCSSSSKRADFHEPNGVRRGPSAESDQRGNPQASENRRPGRWFPSASWRPNSQAHRTIFLIYLKITNTIERTRVSGR